MSMRNGSYYDLTLNFDNTINSGGSGQTSTRIDTSGVFVVETICGTIWLPTTQGGAVAFSALPRQGGITVASNTFPTVDCCRIQLALNDGSWMQSPERFGSFCGTGERPYYPTSPLEFPGGASLIGTLFNDGGGFNVQAQITFHGRRVER